MAWHGMSETKEDEENFHVGEKNGGSGGGEEGVYTGERSVVGHHSPGRVRKKQGCVGWPGV